MKKFSVLISLSAIVLLCSCRQTELPEPIKLPSNELQTVQIGNIELQVPIELKIRPSADEHRIIDNDSNDNDLDRLEEYRVEVTPIMNVACSHTLTGSSEATSLPDAKDKVEWGKVDFWDDTNASEKAFYARKDPNEEYDPICRLPTMYGKQFDVSCEAGENCEQKQRNYEIAHGLYAAYALCSEKDGKTVVICISQMKDDPELAKKIFETFRWTE